MEKVTHEKIRQMTANVESLERQLERKDKEIDSLSRRLGLIQEMAKFERSSS